MSLNPPFHSVSLCFAHTGKTARRILRRALLYFFVALTFVCTQQEAVLHALTHFQEQLAKYQNKDKSPTETTPCLKCLALAPMSGALPSVLPDTLLTRHEVEPPGPSPQISYAHVGDPPFSARAPPTLR